jgi:hypothetical protein
MPQICDMGQTVFTSPPNEGMLWIFSTENPFTEGKQANVKE